MIRLAETGDLDTLIALYETARGYMKAHGNPTQWGDSYPERALLEEDIARRQLYVDVQEGAIHGAFVLALGEDPHYAVIEGGAWLNDAPYGAIHRVAGDGKVKGTFSRCVEFCRGQIGELRIDTHQNNHTMQHLIERHGFVRCGVVYMEDGSPRIAYQNTKEGG